MSDLFNGISTPDKSQVAKLIQDVLVNKRNPRAVVGATFGHLRDITEGRINVVDPTNPFVFLVESSAVNTVAAIIDNESNTRKQYPSLAQTEEDLYLHMSDKDYVDRFASPVNTKFTIAILQSELMAALVPVGLTGIKKVTIPRNTVFTVNDTSFSMQYPVDIKLLVNGSLEITYDTSVTSPLQTLTTNVVNSSVKKLTTTKEDWIFIEVDVQQFSIESKTTTISATSSLSRVWSFVDKFCYARVYQKSTLTGGVWQELKTTHSDQVYNLSEPTVSLRVFENKLQVTVPQIYVTNNKIRGDLRVDIYQTKGYVNMNLSNYSEQAFTVNWLSVDRSENNIYTAPVSQIASLFVYSQLQVTGGKDALTFDELRTRVINNATGVKQLPITNVQIETSLENEGYEVVKNTDVVTNRVFLATKQLPTPFDERLITAAASSVETLIVSMANAVNHPYVKDNGDRIALVPEMLYRNNNGIIEIVSIDEQNAILASDPEIQAELVTNGNFLYTPFHYILDNSKEEFEVRPYYLNDPKTKFVTFVSQNDTTMLQVNTKSHSIRKTDTGYILRVVTRSNASYKALPDTEVQAQLSFVPVGESNRAYLNGTLVGRDANDDRVFEFEILSNTDVDDQDNLYLDSFKMFDLENRRLRTTLSSTLDIFYTTTTVLGSSWVPAAIDGLIGGYLLPLGVAGITNDRVDILFGYSLKTLWARSRTAIVSEQYERYTTDIPLLYTETIYKKDENTGLDFTIDGSGKPIFTVLHEAGDPVLTEAGDQVYKFRAGDIVFDAGGNPVPISPRSVSREVDIMFIEGPYFFATDTASATYRQEITNAVVQWLVGDLTRLTEKLIEQTRLYFYPKTNMGIIRVMVEDGQIVNIDAGHSFVLKLYVNSATYKNLVLRDALSTNAVRVIDTCLKKTRVSVDDILTEVRDALSPDVLAVDITKLGTDKQYTTFTVMDSGDRAGLKKRLKALPNNKLIVIEDVKVDFIEHSIVE